MLICKYAISPSHGDMKNQVLNRMPGGTCSGDVVGGYHCDRESLRAFLFGYAHLMKETNQEAAIRLEKAIF